MKLGFVSAILDGWTFEEMMDTAAGLGYECVEAACWPQGKAERRYAGVSHIDVDNDSREYVNHIHETCKKTGVEISALAYYPNTMDGDFQKREAAIRHLKKVIAFSEKLGVGMVTTFVGRDQTKSVEENLEAFGRIWPPIIQYAEEHGVRIAIENCPMLFGREQWPGGNNLFTSPALWRKMFDMIPSKNFGINYDISSLFMNSERGYSMYTIRTSRFIPRSLRMWESWHIRWNIWNPSFRDWEMWTGDVMCLR